MKEFDQKGNLPTYYGENEIVPYEEVAQVETGLEKVKGDEIQIFEPITTQEELDKVVNARIKVLVEEHKRKIARVRKRNKAKEKQKAKRKSRIKSILLFIVVAIVVFFWTFSKMYPVAIYDFMDKVVSRNLEKAQEIIEKKPETQPKMAWKGTLPDFMQLDMKLVEKYGWSVKYRYKSHTIILERVEDRWQESGYVFYLCVDDSDRARLKFKDISNLSLQQDTDSLYFYVYDENFSVIKVTEEEAKATNVSYYPQDVPLHVKASESFKIEDMVFTQSGNEFVLWKDGVKIDTALFDKGEVILFSRYYSLLGTADNEIYFVYVYKSEEDYKAHIGFEYIGRIDYAREIPSRPYKENCVLFEFPIGTGYKFPIFKKYGELYTCLPLSIKDYISYSTANKDTIVYMEADVNLNMEFVKLDEALFKSAKIYYDYVSNDAFEGYSWVADITLQYKDMEFICKEIPIYGYDREVRLADYAEESLTTEVFTVDEYWDAIEAIRSEYSRLYDSRSDSLKGE